MRITAEESLSVCAITVTMMNIKRNKITVSPATKEVRIKLKESNSPETNDIIMNGVRAFYDVHKDQVFDCTLRGTVALNANLDVSIKLGNNADSDSLYFKHHTISE